MKYFIDALKYLRDTSIVSISVLLITTLLCTSAVAWGATRMDEKPQLLDNKVDRNIMVRFMVDNTVVDEYLIKTRNGGYSIAEDIVPQNPKRKGKDFLGWYWGIDNNPYQYRAIWPMNTLDLPQKIRDGILNGITFHARFGKHVLPNLLSKNGYRLIFHDEFNDATLNKTKWVDRYLSSWSKSSGNTSNYLFRNGFASLQIHKSTEPWCPEFDGQTVVSGFTTGDRNGLHNWTGKNVIRNPRDMKLTHINQYGYYEMRMRGQAGSSRHSAWWLLGFEDDPEQSAEIDIMELQGRYEHKVPPALHSWKDKKAFPWFSGLRSYTSPVNDVNNEYHVYGFDWQKGTGTRRGYPDSITFYIDGHEYAKISVNIDYPMIQLLSLYEKRAGGWTGAWQWYPYPNSMDIDYVRVYKKLPQGQELLPEEKLKITNILAENPLVSHTGIAVKTYDTNGDGIVDYRERNLPGTKSYVRVYWNDGVETQEPVVWDALTDGDIAQLRSGNIVTKKGIVTITSLSHLKQYITQMIITPDNANNTMKRYRLEGLQPENQHSIDQLFNGEVVSRYKTGVFNFNVQDVKNGHVSIIYDFVQAQHLRNIDFYANYGNDQAIKAFRLAFSQDGKSWNFVQANGVDTIFRIPWSKSEDSIERESVNIEKLLGNVTARYYKIVPSEIGNKWGHMAMSEIHFAC